MLFMENSKNKRIVEYLTRLYTVPLFVICCITTFLSLIGSTYYDLYMPNETPSYKSDNPIYAIMGFCAYCIVVGIVFRSKIIKATSRKILGLWTTLIAFLISIFCVIVFNCGVSSDAGSVDSLASMFMAGDYSTYLEQEYFVVYPHQVHMAFYYLVIYYIFGNQNYFAFQMINACCISIVVFLLQEIAFFITQDEMVSKLTNVFSLLLLPLFMYSTYIYGDVPGYTLAIVGTYFGIRLLKTWKWRYLVGMSLAFCAASIIKENVLIFIVANLICMLLASIYNKNWKYFAAIGAIIVSSWIGGYCIDAYCMSKAHIEAMPSGAPREAWIAMGMEEGVCGSGGYNGEFWQVMRDNNYQYDLVKKNRVARIKEHIVYYINNPKEAIKFYYRKYNIQWNDPSFSGLINVEWTSRHREATATSDFLIYGKGRKVLSEILNICHFIVFLLATVGMFKFIKNGR